jgi:hypothetical protein
MFRSALECLALRGRLVEIAATGRREVSFDLADFYHNESRLFGVDTLKRDLAASAEVLEALAPGFVAGDYRAAPIAQTCRLREAREAYRKVAAGAAGRIVLRPSPGLRSRPGPLSGPAADRARRPVGHGAGGARCRLGEAPSRAGRRELDPSGPR